MQSVKTQQALGYADWLPGSGAGRVPSTGDSGPFGPGTRMTPPAPPICEVVLEVKPGSQPGEFSKNVQACSASEMLSRVSRGR